MSSFQEADAAARCPPADRPRLVGAVQTVHGVAVAPIEVERTCPKRVLRPPRHAASIFH
jgi:hypothetical protein